MKTELSNACSQWGADMGRRNSIPADIETAGKLYLEKLKWIDRDYDSGGCYWGGGMGDNVYRAQGETATEQIEIFVRAKSRAAAKELVWDFVPTVKFHR